MATLTWTGAFTILISGLMALYADDIKKMLAFSTMSQIGYMFLEVGVGAILGAQFHLMSHAALLVSACRQGFYFDHLFALPGERPGRDRKSAGRG